MSMALFFRRFMGALALDASAYEDVERDRGAAPQSVLVLAAATAAGGVAALGLGLIGLPGFLAGVLVAFGAWVVWISAVTVIGTVMMPEPQTHADMRELFRTVAFGAAPGVFIAFGAIRPVAPFVFVAVSLWTIAATVVALRQALDYFSTMRAIAVCVVAWALTFGTLALIAWMTAGEVS